MFSVGVVVMNKKIYAVLKIVQGVPSSKSQPLTGLFMPLGAGTFFIAIIASIIMLPIVAGFLYLGITLGYFNDHPDGMLVFYLCLAIAVTALVVVVVLYIIKIIYKIKIKKLLKDSNIIKATAINVQQGVGFYRHGGSIRSGAAPVNNIPVVIIEYEYLDLNNKKVNIKTRFPKNEKEIFFEGEEFSLIASVDNKINLILK